MVYISARPKTVNAVYDGLMSTHARYSGAAGTIVDSRVRDLQEHCNLDYLVRFSISYGSSPGSQADLCFVGFRQRYRHTGSLRSRLCW